MVDVSEKPVSVREAVAIGRIRIHPQAMRLALAGRLKKGAVGEVARLAGIQAAKRTGDLIPLCHPLPLSHVDVELRPRRDGFEIEATVRTAARTGAEMEALHAVAVAALTVYDMVKAADKEMTISDIRLVRKVRSVQCVKVFALDTQRLWRNPTIRVYPERNRGPLAAIYPSRAGPAAPPASPSGAVGGPTPPPSGPPVGGPQHLVAGLLSHRTWTGQTLPHGSRVALVPPSSASPASSARRRAC
jgi:cyclic pyranopterin phosphate synthase